MDIRFKWFRRIMTVLLAVLSILKAIVICGEHYWGYIPCALIAVGLFVLLYGLLRLCLFAAKKLVYAYVKTYKEKVVSHIEVEAIDKYIAENAQKKIPVVKVTDGLTTLMTSKERMAQFMAACEKERKAYIAKKEVEDAEKLEKIQMYARNTLRPFDFTDEELFQVCECIISLVVHGVVVPTLPVTIEKTSRKTLLTQHDLENFGWNIAYQYGIANTLTAQFVLYTFREWFESTETSTIAKNLRNTRGRHNIEIDEHLLDRVDLQSTKP